MFSIDVVKKIWSVLGSRDLSVFVFVTGLTYFLFLVLFSAFIPAWWVGNISKLLPFKILYLFFFINLVICEIKWVPVVVRKCRRPKMPETEQDFQRFRETRVVSGHWPVNRDFERYLRWRGYRVLGSNLEVQSSEVRSYESVEKNFPLPNAHSPVLLYAYRGRFSAVGNLLFHMSFLFILAGVFISLNYRFEKNVLLMEGQASEDGFEVAEIKPKFWGEKLLFTDLMAGIRSGDGEDEVRVSKAANIGGAKITIQGISYTPKYVLRNTNGEVADIGYVNLANFIPGSVDHFSIPGFPYKIYVSIYPDHEVKDGKISTKSMNLLDPRLIIKVVRGKTPVYSGALRLRDEAFFDGFGLSFPEIKYNGTFRVLMDPGMKLIWAAFILMGVGLSWKLLFYKREVAVRVYEDKIYLCVNSDYCPALFLNRCVDIVKGFHWR